MDPIVTLSNSGKNGQKLSNDKIDRNKKNERLRKLRELHMKRVCFFFIITLWIF